MQRTVSLCRLFHSRWVKTATLLLSLSVLAAVAARPACSEIRLGILPRLNPVELYDMFHPLAEHLSSATGEKVSIVIPRDFAAFKNAVREGHLDAGLANPLIYVQLRKELAVQPLAVVSEDKAGMRFRGIFIARTDSPIRTIADLRGRRLAFVDKDSAAGYVFQMMELKHAGMDAGRDFTLLPFAKKHDNVVMAVYNRTADAGGIREDDLEKMRGKVDLKQIRVVGHTAYFPNWPLFISPALDAVRAEKIRNALLALSPGSPAARRVLREAHLAGFVKVADAEYDQLRAAAELAGAL